jgi:hypothetical protein
MGGNFLTHVLANSTLKCINNLETVIPSIDHSKIYTEETNEYKLTNFFPIVDRFHPWNINPEDYNKIRKQRNIVINCSLDMFFKLYILGSYKNNDQNGIKADKLYMEKEYSTWQTSLSILFPNKEYLEVDYQDVFININEERIKEMLDYICFPTQMANEIAIQIEEYTNKNKAIMKRYNVQL